MRQKLLVLVVVSATTLLVLIKQRTAKEARPHSTNLSLALLPATNNSTPPTPRTGDGMDSGKSINTQKVSQILFSAPYQVPEPRATNQFLGPDELRPYAQDLLLSVANKANQAFRFTTSPIALSNGTYRAKCYEEGIDGIFGMNRRYMVSVICSQIEIYADHWFREQVFRDPIRLEALSQEPNQLSAEGARSLAEQSLKTFGLDETVLARLGPQQA